MLGNRFTFVNDMPAMLADLTGAEVVQHTRGGARLAEQLNSKTKMGAKTLEALEKEHWDYVALQEMSNGPIVSKKQMPNGYQESIEKGIGAVRLLSGRMFYGKGTDAERIERLCRRLLSVQDKRSILGILGEIYLYQQIYRCPKTGIPGTA